MPAIRSRFAWWGINDRRLLDTEWRVRRTEQQMRGMVPLSTAKGVWGIIRELSLDEIREQALIAPSLLVLSEREDDARVVARTLTGIDASGFVTFRRLDRDPGDLSKFDAVVVFDPEARHEGKALIDRLRSEESDTAATIFLSSDPADPRAAQQARRAILTQIPERVVAFGRFLPGFRNAAIKVVNDETSMANAQFALVSNVPTVIPLFGSIATVGADFFILTKNQLLLIFKIAAIHGEDVHDSTRIFREMVPVVGAGFFWRTVAREAAALLPLMAGAVPKVAIAYTGTMAIGRAADYYYSTGAKPSREMMKRFYEQSVESLSRRQWMLRRPSQETETTFRLIEDEPATG